MTGPEMMVQSILRMLGVKPQIIEDALVQSKAGIEKIAEASAEVVKNTRRTLELTERNNAILEQLADKRGLPARHLFLSSALGGSDSDSFADARNDLANGSGGT